jgi:hypothetical protein
MSLLSPKTEFGLQVDILVCSLRIQQIDNKFLYLKDKNYLVDISKICFHLAILQFWSILKLNYHETKLFRVYHA